MIAMWVFGVEFFDGNGLQMASGIPMIYFPSVDFDVVLAGETVC